MLPHIAGSLCDATSSPRTSTRSPQTRLPWLVAADVDPRVQYIVDGNSTSLALSQHYKSTSWWTKVARHCGSSDYSSRYVHGPPSLLSWRDTTAHGHSLLQLIAQLGPKPEGHSPSGSPRKHPGLYGRAYEHDRVPRSRVLASMVPCRAHSLQVRCQGSLRSPRYIDARDVTTLADYYVQQTEDIEHRVSRGG